MGFRLKPFFVVATVIAAWALGFFGTARGAQPNVFTPDEVTQLHRADAAKPRHVGRTADILFQEKISATDYGCAQGNESVASPTDLTGSPLDFAPSQLPRGARLVFQDVFKCNNRVFLVSKTYQLPQGYVEIVKSSNRVALALEPQDRQQVLQVAGQPAILARELPAPGIEKDRPGDAWRSWRLLVPVAAGGLLEIRSRGLTVGEGLKLAAELGGQ